METEQLKSFISVASTLSFSKAAKRNYVSQPAISHHIECLERQFGVKLFERSSRGVTLTAAGAEFLPCAMKILDVLQSAEQKMQKIKAGYTETLYISAIPTARPLLLSCVAAFAKRHPEVFLNIHVVNGAEQATAIFDDSCDFSLACLTAQPQSSDILSFRVARIGFSLVLPSNHPLLSDPGPLDLRRLAKDNFISIAPAEGPLLHEQTMTICKNRYLIPRISSYYSEASAVLISVSAGTGFSILPTPLLDEFSPHSVAAIPIEGDDACFDMFLSWKQHSKNPAATKFLSVLRDVYPGLDAYIRELDLPND